MLKRKAKQFVSLLTTLALAGSMLVSVSAPALAYENIPLGKDGYASLHTYITPTTTENIWKVDLSLDVNVKIEPADIVFVVDNSGSMGQPVEESTELDNYAGPSPAYVDFNTAPPGTPSGFNNMVDNGGGLGTGFMSTTYGWAQDPGDPTNPYTYPIGAWKFGHVLDRQLNGQPSSKEALQFAHPTLSTELIAMQGYRFEWMQDGLEEAIDLLLNPAKNGAAKLGLNRISVVAFGDGSTEGKGTDNNIKMDTTAGYPNWNSAGDFSVDAYNWAYPTTATSAGHVWANQYWMSGLTFKNPVTPPFTYADLLTYNSNIVTAGNRNSVDKILNTPTSWIDENGYAALMTSVKQDLVRRQEGTNTAAGLVAAADLLDPAKGNGARKDSKKYVFLLTDGVELNDRTATAAGNFDFTESLAAAANLKKLGVDIFGCGVFENDNSMFRNNAFVPSAYSSTLTGQGSFASLKDYVVSAPVANGADTFDGYAGEQHLLRTIMPLKDSSTTLVGAPYAAGVGGGGSSFMSNISNYTGYNVNLGTGYQTYVDDINPAVGNNADWDKLHYYHASDRNGVIAAFRDFVKNLYAATNIASDISLSQNFDLYQMPGKQMFEATGSQPGSFGSGGGKNIVWTIPDIGAAGGSFKLTFYVQSNTPMDQNGVWQSLLASFKINYVDYLNNATSKGFPQVFVQGENKTPAAEVDHRLDDSGYAKVTRRAENAAWVIPTLAKGNVSITDVKATAQKGNKVKLNISAPKAEDLYYQWQYLNDDNEWKNIPGAISSVYTVTGLKAGKTYTFRCMVRAADSVYTYSKEVTAKVGDTI